MVFQLFSMSATSVVHDCDWPASSSRRARVDPRCDHQLANDGIMTAVYRRRCAHTIIDDTSAEGAGRAPGVAVWVVIRHLRGGTFMAHSSAPHTQRREGATRHNGTRRTRRAVGTATPSSREL